MIYKLAILAVLLLSASLGWAGHDRRTSLDEAVSDARDHYPGRVLSAETRQHNGRDMHNVRILTRDGRVRRYRVDAEDERPGPSHRRPFRR
jgi:hypothetical protein